MRRTAAIVVAVAVLVGIAPAAARADSSTPTPSPSTSGPAISVPDQTNGPRPVMIVLDTSGSMEDTDGHGVRKLSGAIDSLVDLVRQMPTRADVGLWTYPGGAPVSNGCRPGRAQVSVGPLDRTATSAQIRAMTADGDTPTADALLAAVDELKRAGYKGATLLLVSDGLANCGEDPCTVAQQIRSEGFDVTVQALGFQLSPDGAQQLQCIANATGGNYRDVADSSTLLPDLIAASSPDLKLDVRAPDKVPPQSTGTITATITNTTPNDAHNITVTLTLGIPSSTGSKRPYKTAIPAVLNPVIRIGNVPAGATVTRSWTFSAGLPSPDPVPVAWRVIAFGRDVIPVSQKGTLTLTGKVLTLKDAGGWLRDLIDQGGRAVIFGDSYSSGEGALTYFTSSHSDGNYCHRSPFTYAMSLFPADRQPDVLACSGAVIANLFTPKTNAKGEIPQLQKLDRLTYAPDLAFMTMGGNDIMFAPLITDCALAGDCSTWEKDNPAVQYQPDKPKVTMLERTELLIRQTEARLVLAYEQVARALNTPDRIAERDGRIAQLVVLTYPAVLPRSNDRSCGGLLPSEISFGNTVVNELDAAVTRAVDRARQDGYPVHLVADNINAVQPDHTACDKEPWINPLSLATGITDAIARQHIAQQLVHPNVSGYQAFTQRIIAASQQDQLLPFTAPLPTGSDTELWEQERDPTAILTLDNFLDPEATTDFQVTLEAGVPVLLKVSGFADGSPVLLTSYSQPRAMGTLTADMNGVASGTMFIPADLTAGRHRIVAEGFGSDGSPMTQVMIIDVVEPMPWAVRMLPVLGLAFLVAGLVLAWLARRRRRESRIPT